MFSSELQGEIITDERLRSVPLEYQSTIMRVVAEVIEKRFRVENPEMSREQILNEILGG